MSATVKLLPSGHEYFVAGRDTLLEAALKAGLHLDYGCASGNCGKCRVRVLKGDVSKVRDFDYVFSAREREQGYVLACSHTAVTDLLVEASEALAPKDLPAQEVRASVRKVAALGPDLYQVYVQTPRTQTLRFMAGQRVDLTTEDGQRLCLPVASCPCDARNLQFIVRAPADSKLLATLQGGGSNRPTVLINGPHGEFLLEEESERPAVLISVGDGIAPIKSLAEHAIAIDRAVTLHLLRIDELPPGSHIGNLCRSWHDALDNFSYARLPSTLGPGDTLKELLQRFPRLDGCDLYVAAPQAWLTGFREALDGADTSPNTLKLDAADY